MNERCLQVEAILRERGEEALSADVGAALHARECPECRALIRALALTDEGLVEIAAAAAPPARSIPSTAVAAALAGGASEEEPMWYVADVEAADRDASSDADAAAHPVPQEVVERLWEDGGIDADTMVWRAGMGDWMRLGDVPELAYVLSLPRSRAADAEGELEGGAALAPRINGSARVHEERGFDVGAGAGAGAGAAAGAGAGAARPTDDAHGEPSWQPAAARALSELVSSELQGKPKVQEPARGEGEARLPGIELPQGLPQGFAASWQGPQADSFAPQPVRPEPAVTPTFTVPWRESAPARRRGVRPWHLWVGVLGSSLATAAAVLLVLHERAPRFELEPATASPVVAPQGAAPVATPASGGGGAAAAVPSGGTHTGGEASAPAAAGQPAGPTSAAGTATPASGGQGSASAGAAADKPPPGGSAHGGARPVASGAGDKPGKRKTTAEEPDTRRETPKAPPPPALPATAKAALTKDEIVAGIKKNGSNVGPCILEARKRSEMVPGSYTFTLDWTIEPNGSVSSPRLSGPATVLGTSLPGCFAGKMRAWTFPASQKQTPIRNFPFGPINVR